MPLSLSLLRAYEGPGARRRIAYERLLLDVMHGNSTLFVRRDEVEEAWRWGRRRRRSHWAEAGMAPKPYAAGSWLGLRPAPSRSSNAPNGRGWTDGALSRWKRPTRPLQRRTCPSPSCGCSGWVADGPGDSVTVGELVAHFGPRAFGAVLFVFAMPNLLPLLPPGTSTVLGLPLLLIAPQLALGGRKPWIPNRLARHVVDRETIGRVCQRASPWVKRAEQLTTRRLDFMFGGPGDAVIGLSAPCWRRC